MKIHKNLENCFQSSEKLDLTFHGGDPRLSWGSVCWCVCGCDLGDVGQRFEQLLCSLSFFLCPLLPNSLFLSLEKSARFCYLGKQIKISLNNHLQVIPSLAGRERVIKWNANPCHLLSLYSNYFIFTFLKLLTTENLFILPLYIIVKFCTEFML